MTDDAPMFPRPDIMAFAWEMEAQLRALEADPTYRFGEIGYSPAVIAFSEAHFHTVMTDKHGEELRRLAARAAIAILQSCVAAGQFSSGKARNSWSNLRDALASDTHEAWMASCRKDGKESMPSNVTGEEQMVPFAQLSDAVKAYDYLQIDTILESLFDRGFTLGRYSK